MKITHNDDLIKGVHPQKKDTQKPSPQKDFGAILKEKIENTTAAHTGIQSSIRIDSIAPVKTHGVCSSEEISTIDRTEGLLNLLDSYRHKLADPSFTLKDIYPLISEIENEKEQLKPVLDSIAQGDELKNILNHTLVTAAMEVIRFNKGDYNTF